MNTSQLQSFIAVAQTMNFSEAARCNYVSQPTISNHISALENELGVKLFERSTRNVTLTPAGVEFVPYAEEILNNLQTAKEKLHRVKVGVMEPLNIATIPTAQPFVQKCVETFSKRNPHTLLNINFVNGAEQNQAIFDKKCDFSFACLSTRPIKEDIDYFPIQRIGLSFVIPQSYSFLYTESDYNALSRVPFLSIIPSEGPLLNKQILTICKNRNFTPNVTTYYNAANAILISIKAGIGISILPKPLLADYKLKNTMIADINGDDSYYYLFVCWKKNNNKPSVIKFRDLLYEMFPDCTKPQPSLIKGEYLPINSQT